MARRTSLRSKINVITLLLIVLVLYANNLFAQVYGSNGAGKIDTGKIRVNINSNGMLFGQWVVNNNGQVESYFYGLEAPKDSGSNPILEAALWMGGIDDMGQLHVAASTYRQIGNDFFPGPIDATDVAVMFLHGIKFG